MLPEDEETTLNRKLKRQMMTAGAIILGLALLMAILGQVS